MTWDPENPDDEKDIRIKQARERYEQAAAKMATTRAALALIEARQKRAKSEHEKACAEEGNALRHLAHLIEND